MACDCADFTAYASRTPQTPTAVCFSKIAPNRASILSRSLSLTSSPHSHGSQKSTRIGYSEFCNCYASAHSPARTVSRLCTSMPTSSTPKKSTDAAAHSPSCACTYRSPLAASRTYLHTPAKISEKMAVSSAWKKSRSNAYSASARSITSRYASRPPPAPTSRLRQHTTASMSASSPYGSRRVAALTSCSGSTVIGASATCFSTSLRPASSKPSVVYSRSVFCV